MTKKILTLLLLAFISLASTTHASDRVVAVVNNNVITKLDLDARVALTLRTLNAEMTPAQRDTMVQQTLQQLVNEEIVRQYAEKNTLIISDRMLKARLAQLEAQFKLSPGSFSKRLGPLSDTALNQVHDSLFKDMIISRQIAPRISVTNEEVEQLLNNLMEHSKFQEYELYQIFLSADEGRSIEATQALIQDLYTQLQQGADFKTLAQTYSEDGNAKQGGRIGWLSPAEMSAELQNAVNALPVGHFSAPFNSTQGTHIVFLNDTQNANKPEKRQFREVNLTQLVVTSEDEASLPLLQEDLTRVRKRIKTLSDLERLVMAAQDKPTHNGSHLRQWITLSDLTDPTADVVANLPIGQLSDVVQDGHKLYIFFVNEDRLKETDQIQAYRARIRSTLTTNRGDRMARRFFRNLRRQAYVDLRL